MRPSFYVCKYCKKPIVWLSKNGKWYPRALEGGQHVCSLNSKGKPLRRLQKHELLDRRDLHIPNEDQIARILKSEQVVLS